MRNTASALVTVAPEASRSNEKINVTAVTIASINRLSQGKLIRTYNPREAQRVTAQGEDADPAGSGLPFDFTRFGFEPGNGATEPIEDPWQMRVEFLQSIDADNDQWNGGLDGMTLGMAGQAGSPKLWLDPTGRLERGQANEHLQAR